MAEISPIMEVFRKLTKEQQKVLNEIFEAKEVGFLLYDPSDKSKFIGLNINAPNYIKEIEMGSWSLGKIV